MAAVRLKGVQQTLKRQLHRALGDDPEQKHVPSGSRDTFIGGFGRIPDLPTVTPF